MKPGRSRFDAAVSHVPRHKEADLEKIEFPESAWPLMRKALEHIAAHPEEFYMPWWVGRVNDFDEEDWQAITNATGRPLPECGTVACLAGHIALASGLDPIKDYIGGTVALRRLGIRIQSEVGIRLISVFAMTHIRRYPELTSALNECFTFPEPLPTAV